LGFRKTVNIALLGINPQQWDKRGNWAMKMIGRYYSCNSRNMSEKAHLVFGNDLISGQFFFGSEIII